FVKYGPMKPAREEAEYTISAEDGIHDKLSTICQSHDTWIGVEPSRAWTHRGTARSAAPACVTTDGSCCWRCSSGDNAAAATYANRLPSGDHSYAPTLVPAFVNVFAA